MGPATNKNKQKKNRRGCQRRKFRRATFSLQHGRARWLCAARSQGRAPADASKIFARQVLCAGIHAAERSDPLPEPAGKNALRPLRSAGCEGRGARSEQIPGAAGIQVRRPLGATKRRGKSFSSAPASANEIQLPVLCELRNNSTCRKNGSERSYETTTEYSANPSRRTGFDVSSAVTHR